MAFNNPTFVNDVPLEEDKTFKTNEQINGDNKIEIDISPTKKSSTPVVYSSTNSGLIYSVEEAPPWYMCILLGGQQYLTMIGSTIIIPFSLINDLCIAEDDPSRGALVSTIIFVSGIVTLLQSTFGVRLPIVQGGTFTFLVPASVILTTFFDKCDTIDLTNMSANEQQELWQVRMRTLQGSIIVSSLIQMVIGLTGLIGLILKWMTPLTIVPTVGLIGLALFDVAIKMAGTHWGISSLTMFLLILFSQYLKDIRFPFPNYSKIEGCQIAWIPVFGLFPVLLSILISWGLCWILTATDAIGEGSALNTTSNLEVIFRAPWFSVPYPGQWGIPTVNAAAVFGIFAGVLASMVESIGDYYACARLCGAAPPPTHAVNRGIFMEGLGCVLAGIWGTGNGTTSYSENIGAIGITKIGSRRVIQFAGIFMLFFGVIGKFGAMFATIPAPVLGGVFCVMFSIITAVGLSSLQFVDLNSSRNLFVMGFSLFMGLAIPTWIKIEENGNMIQTGSEIFDSIIKVLLQTSMFVGGFIGFFLDNTIPGTDEERGVDQWRKLINPEAETATLGPNTYDFPIGMETLKRISFMQYIPISPTFNGWGWLVKKIKKK